MAYVRLGTRKILRIHESMRHAAQKATVPFMRRPAPTRYPLWTRWRPRTAQRCALAGDQVGQGHAVDCEAGKLCTLVDTVLKGVQAPAGRNTETYDDAMAPLVR